MESFKYFGCAWEAITTSLVAHTEASEIESLGKSYPFSFFSNELLFCALVAVVLFALSLLATDGAVVLITTTFYGLLYKCDDCVTEQEDEIGYVDVSSE